MYITNLECHPIDFVIHNMDLKMMHVSAAGLYMVVGMEDDQSMCSDGISF